MKHYVKVLREIPEIKTPDPETGEIIVTPARLALVDEMVTANEYKPFFKTNWNHDTDQAALASGTLNIEPSKTQASQADETNINTIMRRYGITGPEQLAPPPPSFAEFPDEWDMATVIKIHRDAEDAFMKLPAEVRYRFENDLARYVATVNGLQAAGDLKGLRALGLDVPDPPEPPNAAGDPPQTDPK